MYCSSTSLTTLSSGSSSNLQVNVVKNTLQAVSGSHSAARAPNQACNAGRMEEEESAIEGLLLLWRRLHAEMQRMRATPATRLLDDVLRAMNPASELNPADRQEVYCH